MISSHRQTLNERELSVSRLFPKYTVAVAIVGATIGNTGVLAYDMCFPDSLVGIDTESHVGNLYLEYFLRNEKERIRTTSYSSGGQPNIKLETLNPYPLPLPPFEEQNEIVRRIETRHEKAKAHLNKLTQSILAKAFHGELVPQDPNDVPATLLLERIRAERETEEGKSDTKVSKRLRRKTRRKKLENVGTEAAAFTQPQKERKQPPEESTLSPDARQEVTAKVRKPRQLFDTVGVMAAFRKACRNRGALSREELMKEFSLAFGYKRLGSVLSERLKGHLRAAIRRGIVETDGKWVRAATRTIEDYDREFLVDALRSVMRSGTFYNREEVIRAAAEYLGFSRMNGKIEEDMRSARRAGIRQGKFIPDQGSIRRF
jgi:type I restriction enzyme S subunit